MARAATAKANLWRRIAETAAGSAASQSVHRRSRALLAAIAVTAVLGVADGGPSAHRIPLECSRGKKHQIYEAAVAFAPQTQLGSRFTVRIDGASSGKLQNKGLKYIFDMTTDFRLAGPASIIAGSPRILPDTGSANVREGARIWSDSREIHLQLPAHVEKGDAYTPPSIEFDVDASGAKGAEFEIQFDRYWLRVRAVLLGELKTVCNPTPRPYTLATIPTREHMARALPL